jgi:hypothetical protein
MTTAEPYQFMEQDPRTGEWHLPPPREIAKRALAERQRELNGPDLEAKIARQFAELDAEDNWANARALSTIDRSPPPPLLLSRLDPAGHTILHGTGGTGKGKLAAWWVGRLVQDGHKVLILDYENHPDEWARRHFGLAGVAGAEAILHVSPLVPSFRAPHGPIWQTAELLHNLISEHDVTYVVIDSIVAACGGADPMEPGTPARYAGALQALATPALSLAHVTKADDLRYPFGSIFWHNLARLTWSLAKDGERRILANRKANNYENAGRSVLSITWRDGLPVDILEQAYSAVLADRIDEVLTDGALTVAAIVRELNDASEEGEQPVKADSVRAALRRGVRADPKRYTVTGDDWSRL